MKRIVLIIICLASFTFLYGCNDDSVDSPDLDTKPDPVYPEGAFDYAQIKPHPRLLMSSEDEEELKSILSTNMTMKKIHDHIITQCNMLVGQDEMVYKKDGKRLLAVSREAFKRIFFLSYGYRMTGSQLYLIKAKAELNAVINFPDWNPSHFLDVGEMAMGVAIGYDWLYDALDDVTKENIRQAIVEKAFNASKVSSHNWFYDRKNNWNQVCNAGLVYGALAIMEDEPTASVEIIEKALSTNRKVLDIYAPDGNYPEGPGYWAYGTSFQVMMIAALQSALGGDAGLSEAPGFMASAEYMLYMNSPSGQWFNYSDCGRVVQPLPAMFWFAEKNNDPSLLFEELKLLNKGNYFRRFEEERLLPVALIFGKNVALNQETPPQKSVWSGKGTTPVVVVRKGWNGETDQYLGVKGGKAVTDHAHMDAGSFVYDIGATRWAMDFGMQSYGVVEAAGVDLWNMGQNSERWDVFRLHNKNHNTITINNQRHNVNGEAQLIEVYDSDIKKGAKLDLTDALNLADELENAIRTVTLENDTYLQIVDELKAGEQPVEVYWNMVSSGSVKIIDANTMVVSKEGKELEVKVNASLDFELDTDRSTTPATDYETKNGDAVMLGFTSTIPANQKATYTITLKQR